MNRFGTQRIHPGKVLAEPCRLLVILATLAAGCGLPGRPDPAERPVPANEVLEFSVLYAQNCAGCHGANGKVGPGPPLNDPLFRAIVPEAELESILTKGRKNTLMPAFAIDNGGTLTSAQIQVLVKQIKGVPYKNVAQAGGEKAVIEDVSGIKSQWGSPGELPSGAPMYLARTAGPNAKQSGSKETGAEVFARACAVCHGDHGQGIRKGNEMVRDIHDPVFLALTSDQVLRRYVITGRADLNMPNFAEPRPSDPHFKSLTDDDVTNLVELLASWR